MDPHDTNKTLTMIRLVKRDFFLSATTFKQNRKNNKKAQFSRAGTFPGSRTNRYAVGRWSSTSTYSKTSNQNYLVASNLRTHLIFGANTDVGKTIISAGLVRTAINSISKNVNKNDNHLINYIKPLQSGGSDEEFVRKYATRPTIGGYSAEQLSPTTFQSRTLFKWDLAASPHLASRVENKPQSDEEVLSSLRSTLSSLIGGGGSVTDGNRVTTFLETAGGVLSPSASSPLNDRPRHAKFSSTRVGVGDTSSWGWSTQADLFQSLNLPVVLVGDGRLGGIISTLSSLELLIVRGYNIHEIILIDDPNSNSKFGHGSNVTALREYASRKFKLRSGSGQPLFQKPSESAVSLPPLPPYPEPLFD